MNLRDLSALIEDVLGRGYRRMNVPIYGNKEFIPPANRLSKICASPEEPRCPAVTYIISEIT
jgi:hypothetical protein